LSDVILFSVKSKNVENRKKIESFEIYLSLRCAPTRLTPLVCLPSHLSVRRGGGEVPSSVVATSSL